MKEFWTDFGMCFCTGVGIGTGAIALLALVAYISEASDNGGWRNV